MLFGLHLPLLRPRPRVHSLSDSPAFPTGSNQHGSIASTSILPSPTSSEKLHHGDCTMVMFMCVVILIPMQLNPRRFVIKYNISYRKVNDLRLFNDYGYGHVTCMGTGVLQVPIVASFVLSPLPAAIFNVTAKRWSGDFG